MKWNQTFLREIEKLKIKQSAATGIWKRNSCTVNPAAHNGQSFVSGSNKQVFGGFLVCAQTAFSCAFLPRETKVYSIPQLCAGVAFLTCFSYSRIYEICGWRRFLGGASPSLCREIYRRRMGLPDPRGWCMAVVARKRRKSSEVYGTGWEVLCFFYYSLLSSSFNWLDTFFMLLWSIG